ncbi:uncharacterized protein LOC116298381 [Actinia tenebrosa]|uniref:Mitogen-activated protein kinase kinase kinase 19 n=1 Tax=Actinia tenebrosa TaxID=6105 RepID=A0A6P8I2A2_ACTTE|nr:uncharacterized protein LOC116298381 [Actinia tenebrosa]
MKSKHVRRSQSMTNKTPGYMAPRPPGTSPSDSNRIKYRSQTRQISSFSANAGLQSCRQEWELPKLSIKNIELRITSALHSDVPLQSPCNRYSTIQRFRLLNNPSSLPLTPNTYESTSRMSDYSSLQGSGRIKLPKTLAPLSREGRTSPADTRQECSRNSLYPGHELVGDVLDLDNLQSPSKCQPSLAKIFVFDSEDRDIVQPPSSPCEENGLELDYPPSPRADNKLEYKKSDDKEIELDNNENTVRENINQETVKDKKDEEFLAGSIKEKNENNAEEPSSIENKETHSSCNDCVVNGGCDDDDDCCKTQTFSTTDLSKFWIPCTKNGETGLGNIGNATKTSNSEQNSPSLEKNNTNELKSTNNVTNKMVDDKERTAIVDEARKDENRKNSVSFYVDFGGIKTHKSVNRTWKCGRVLSNEKLNKCEECTNRLPEKKTFWISLDGETSDGETEGVSGKKKCVERKGSSSEEGERFSRRAQSLPENKLLLKPKFISKNCIDLDVETQEQTLREKFLIVSEESFEIQPKRPEDSRNEVSEAVAKDDKELEDGLKFYSEDTFVIEKNVQESGGQSGNTITQGTSERDQEVTVNKVDECNDGASELDKDGKENKRVVAGEHGELKSSIVLQSLSLDDDQQHNEENEKSISTETTNPHCSREVKPQTESAKEVVKTLKKDMPVFLKTAWSNDGQSEEQPLGVQICNAFPSPVPPVNFKPEVQPPIGNSLGKTKPRKTNSGKLKKKASTKESKKKDDKNTIGKEQSSSCGKRGKKGKKGKGKKTEPMFKEISVHQSFGCTGYDSVTSNVACEIKEGMLSPDLDKVPTLSMDSRGTTKLVKRKFSILSPIPESPRSTVSVTPRTGDDGGSGENDVVCTLEGPIPESPRSTVSVSPRTRDDGGSGKKDVAYTLEVPETSQVNEELVKQEERQTELMEEEKVVTGDEDDDVSGGGGIVNDDKQDEQIEVFDEGVDEVDGGMFSRFFNMCMPRLKMVSPESDSEALASEGDDDDDHHDDNDDGIINNTYQEEQLKFPVDEADQDMEDLIQDILENYDHIKKDDDHESAQEVHHDDLSVNNHSLSEQDNTGTIQETSVTSSDTNSSNTDHHLEKQTYEKENLKEENWTTSYVRQMPEFGPWELDASDDVFIQSEKEDEERFCTALNEEIMSDDSSYVSCESLSYTVSESSTTASNDSYFSSQESFPHGLSSSSHDVTMPGSVDIILHEQIHKPQTNTTNSSNSGSNDSRSTLRPRSNSNSSETSMPSFFPSASRGLVRSQVSSGSGSLSSATSCGEELQWQKGSVLGKGGFGTVYLGLVNTGEMIAVKQVELNNKDESEAEKQYDKLQEEVSLLKSLRHQNIVKYIGTCLDDNSVVNIFMEFVPGGSIAQALKRFGAFVEPVFQRYTKQILSGVDYLHKKNVIHRDIKGGNIMLMPNGVIKLIDFGCAKRLCMSLSLSRSSIMHSMKGTPYWMAPEVIKETSGQGTKSDIWSIGCTVYEMATGNPPWSPMDPFAAMFAIGNGNTVPQLDNSFSEAARNFTAACMTREPSARPSVCELLQHEFISQLL